MAVSIFRITITGPIRKLHHYDIAIVLFCFIVDHLRRIRDTGSRKVKTLVLILWTEVTKQDDHTERMDW